MEELEAEAPIRWGEKETKESVVAQARAMIGAWLNWKEKPPGRIIAVEEQFEVELAPWLPKLQGRVDLVVEGEDGKICLVDLKTSRTHWGEEQIIQGTDQLVLYREGLRQMIESTGRPVKLAWEIVGKVKAPWVERIELTDPPVDARRPTKIASIVLESIERQVFVPSPGWPCLSCPFRGPCREW